MEISSVDRLNHRFEGLRLTAALLIIGSCFGLVDQLHGSCFSDEHEDRRVA